MYRGAACLVCKQLFEWQNISQQQDISTKHQHQRSKSVQDSPILSICFEVLNWHVSAWRCWTRGGITSIPTSITRRLCCRVYAALQSVSVCFAVQIVLSASLHSFKLVFLVSARNESVAAIRTRDWRAAGPCCPRAVRHSPRASVWNLKRSCDMNCTSASPWLSASVIICLGNYIGCVLRGKRETSIVKKRLYPSSESVCFNCPRSTQLPEALRT